MVVPLLRELDNSRRYFWKPGLSEQLSLVVRDKRFNSGIPRPLPPNEMIAMALNEIAAHKGYGFFFFLPNANTYGDKGGDPACRPQHRLPPAPGRNYPSIGFVACDWTEQKQDKFFRASHRFRYTACHALLNPLQPNTEFWSIQVAGDKKFPLYQTSTDSLVVIQTTSSLYCARVTELESDAVIGKVPAKKNLAGLDSRYRLDTAFFLWEGPKTASDRQKLVQMEQFAVTDMEALYSAICRKCSTEIDITMTGKQLRTVIPRPAHPFPGTDLGERDEPDGIEAQSSEEDTTISVRTRKRKHGQ